MFVMVLLHFASEVCLVVGWRIVAAGAMERSWLRGPADNPPIQWAIYREGGNHKSLQPKRYACSNLKFADDVMEKAFPHVWCPIYSAKQGTPGAIIEIHEVPKRTCPSSTLLCSSWCFFFLQVKSVLSQAGAS